MAASRKIAYSDRLFGKDAKGAARVWEIEVSHDGSGGGVVITRKYGTLGGKLASSVREVSSGKNLGRANATTPLQQAVSEAQALYKKTLESGYCVTETESNPGVREVAAPTSCDNKTFFPMLAQDFEKHKGKLNFPCLAQPKLDGIRLLIKKRADGSVELTTRNGKTVKSSDFGLLGERVSSCGAIPPGVILDGEMYLHDHMFQVLTSMFKNGEPGLVYNVYDIYDTREPNMGTQQRQALLDSIFGEMKGSELSGRMVRVSTWNLPSESDVKPAHDQAVEQGYEGLMLRNADAPYEPGKRSGHLLKYKVFMTDEYVIADVVEADGNDKGTAVFVCRTEGGQEFNVRLKATREQRRSDWQAHQMDPRAFAGKLLTVKYQELTGAGLPRFPVGLAVRDYE